MMPSEIELKCFLMIARHQNLTRAAVDLGMKQPSLSQSLHSLEKKLGQALFRRLPTGVLLTREGEEFKVFALQLLKVWSDAKGMAVSNASEVSGQVRLGCHSGVALYLLPPLLEVVDRRFPAVDLQVHHDFSRNVVNSVRLGELDIGVAVNPSQISDLVIRVIGNDTFTIFSCTTSASELNRVAYVPLLAQSSILLSECTPAPIRSLELFETSSLEVCCSLLYLKGTAALVPQRVVKVITPSAIPLKNSPSVRDKICLVYRREAWKTSGGRDFVRTLESELRSALSPCLAPPS